MRECRKYRECRECVNVVNIVRARRLLPLIGSYAFLRGLCVSNLFRFPLRTLRSLRLCVEVLMFFASFVQMARGQALPFAQACCAIDRPTGG